MMSDVLELAVAGKAPPWWLVLLRRWHLLLAVFSVAAAAAYAGTYMLATRYTALTSFLPPQQQQNAAAAALSSLGPLAANLANSTNVIRTPADQYVALLQSVTVSDRIVDRFRLRDAYAVKLSVDARTVLARRVRIAVGKKDGLISVEVEDESATRAADIANQYVEELRRQTGALAITEAQQRRVFFERQLQKSRDSLTQAQLALQSSGFNQGALRSEPKAAAEGYSRLRSQIAAAEVKLAAMRGSLAEATPEIRQQQMALTTLRSQLAKAETPNDTNGNADYVGRFREFKYQEALFEMFARQYELARVDESREGALIQVVDPAKAPERPSGPKRLPIAVSVALLFTMLAALVILSRQRSKDFAP